MSRENGRSSDRPMSYKTSGERSSRSYRSPPSRTFGSSSNRYSNNKYEEHRSRRDDEPAHSSCLSKFYRERFGSHSPEDYLNLRLSQFDRDLSKDDIRQLLEREFKALTPFEIKIVTNPENDSRLAYVNFERPECAKIVRRNMVPRLQKVLGKRIMLDPTGVIRDQEGKFIPDRYNRAVMAAAADRGRSPTGGRLSSSSARRRSPPSLNGNGGGGSSTFGKRRDGVFGNLNQVSHCKNHSKYDDTQASRTIFVGNLPGDVRETELKRIFEIFGNIEHVDIKTLQDSNAAFAFILYRTVEEAIEARSCQHNKPIRPGSSRCQIGYGKSQQSHRLYVGGLGAWATYDMLMSEFERYGVIDYVEYESGDKFAYVRFDAMDAAIEACAQMKHFDLSGKGNHITVDYVKDVRVRKRGRSDSDDEYETKRRHGPRTPSLSPGRSPTESGYIDTLEELREQIASTWKGIVTLKKVECPLSVYRIFGREHMIQDYLRDEEGNALRLNIIQRLPIDVDYYKRTIELNKDELALMIAVEGSQPVEPLIKYLKEKNAAGVISVQGGAASVHVLTYSPIAERLIKFFAPRIAILKPGCNYLLIALKKTSAAGGTTVSSSSLPQSFQTTLGPPPPEPMRLLPPPPLPFLVKHEVDQPLPLPLREDRPAFQMQLKIKSESSESAVSSTITAPPIPPTFSPPSGPRNSAKSLDGRQSSSSSEGENDHRRPPTQLQHHQQLNQRRHRKDDEEDEEEEDDDREPSFDDDENGGSRSDSDDNSPAGTRRSNSAASHAEAEDEGTEEKEDGRISSDSSSNASDD